MTRWRLLVAALAVAVLAGCGNGAVKDDPILRLSGQESLTEGKALMERAKYAQARDYLTHAFEVEPNSASGREALLLVADAHFLQGGNQNYIKAEGKYRDFQNRFPTSDRSAYVQFQIASSLARRALPPDRDQSATRKAVEAFEDVIRLFPTSEYVAHGREEIVRLRQTMAESEFLKGHFNLKLRLPRAAVARFEGLLEDYPDFDEIDKALFFLSESYLKADRRQDAVETRERLRTEFPDSEYIGRLKELEPEKIDPAPPADELDDDDAAADTAADTDAIDAAADGENRNGTKQEG